MPTTCEEAADCLRTGDELRQSGDLSAAIDRYLRAIRLDAEFGDAYHRLWNQVRGGKPSASELEAVAQCCRDVLARNGRHKIALDVLACVLTRQGSLAEARQCLESLCFWKNQAVHPEFTRKHWHTGTRRGPDFLIIGAMKCGTCSLYSYLAKHPLVLPAAEKEVRFFVNKFFFDQGIDWYLAHFPPIPPHGGYLAGEATPAYMRDFKVPERVKQYFPHVKLIAILRDPVDRAVSQYHYLAGEAGWEHSLEHVLEEDMRSVQSMSDLRRDVDGKSGCISAGLYVYQLQHWMTIFPKGQFLILRTEDMQRDAAAVTGRVFAFLGLPPHPLTVLKSENVGAYPRIDANLRRRLADFYRPHNRRLEEFLGMKFDWQ